MPDPRWEIPFDKYGKLAPHMRARGVSYASKVQSIASSTYFSVNAQSTLVQITAITKDMMLKWTNNSEDYAKSTNCDEYIPSGTTVELMIPLTAGNFYDGFQIAGIASGGSVAIVEK
jgi:hypothetical protein